VEDRPVARWAPSRNPFESGRVGGINLGSPAAKGLLCHRNIATTQQHYIRDVPEEAVCAVEKIDALFAKTSGPVQ